MKYIYVLALYHSEFEQFRSDYPAVGAQYVYVMDENQLQGLQDPVVVILPGAYNRHEWFSRMIEFIRTRCGRNVRYE